MNFIDYLIETKNYSALNTVNEYSKMFAKMTHYTTSKGAKGIMKEGFKPGSYKQSNVSAFLLDDDTIRNDERYNMNTMIDNVIKRENRYGYGAKRKDGRVMRQRTPYDNNKDIDEQNKKYGDEMYFTKNPLSRYGTLQTGSNDFLYNHGWMERHFPDNDWDGVAKRCGNHRDTNPVDGPSYTNGFGKDAKFGHRVTFPAGYKQLSQINGLNRGASKEPVYRVKFDTSTDEGIEPSWGAGNEVPINIINKDSQKLEIPRGMYKGTKKAKRGYINDYNEFNPNDFNTDDVPTREAVEDMKKKLTFLGKGHGKKK